MEPCGRGEAILAVNSETGPLTRHTPVQTSNITGINFIASGANSSSSYALTRAPRLDAFNASGNFGQAIGLTARLRGRPNGENLTGKSVTFSIDGTSVGTGATNVNGYAQFAYRISDTLSTGSHVLTADFAGDTDYAASSATGTLTALATNTTLSSVSLSGTIGQTQVFKFRLKRTSDLNGVVGQTVLCSVDGSVVGTATTDAQGFAIYAYAIPELSAGSHTLTANFDGTSQYAASSSSGTLTVAKSNTKLPTDQITGAQSSSVNLIAYLKRSTDGSRLAGRTVTFKVDGVAVGTATTDGSGVATFTYTLNLTVGTHKITTSFAGDAFDNSSTGGASLIVTESP
ncbi:MAG: Ig-like domain-containing protein [Armatimonadetes bacterium]|nr:Ig-like domain-containing protein [Armatimonadota bacterium]